MHLEFTRVCAEALTAETNSTASQEEYPREFPGNTTNSRIFPALASETRKYVTNYPVFKLALYTLDRELRYLTDLAFGIPAASSPSHLPFSRDVAQHGHPGGFINFRLSRFHKPRGSAPIVVPPCPLLSCK